MITKCLRCDAVATDKKCQECGSTRFYVITATLGKLDERQPWSQALDGYPIYIQYKDSIFDRKDLSNKTPRTFPIKCNAKKCMWNLRERQKEGLGNCDRDEAWNDVEAQELEIPDDMSECPWYAGSHHRKTLWSIQNQH